MGAAAASLVLVTPFPTVPLGASGPVNPRTRYLGCGGMECETRRKNRQGEVVVVVVVGSGLARCSCSCSCSWVWVWVGEVTTAQCQSDSSAAHTHASTRGSRGSGSMDEVTISNDGSRCRVVGVAAPDDASSVNVTCLHAWPWGARSSCFQLWVRLRTIPLWQTQGSSIL